MPETVSREGIMHFDSTIGWAFLDELGRRGPFIEDLLDGFAGKKVRITIAVLDENPSDCSS